MFFFLFSFRSYLLYYVYIKQCGSSCCWNTLYLINNDEIYMTLYISPLYIVFFVDSPYKLSEVPSSKNRQSYVDYLIYRNKLKTFFICWQSCKIASSKSRCRCTLILDCLLFKGFCFRCRVFISFKSCNTCSTCTSTVASGLTDGFSPLKICFILLKY